MKVKLIVENHIFELEKQINEFSKRKDIEIINIDIKSIYKGDHYLPSFLGTIIYKGK